MLNKNKILISMAMGVIANLPSNSNAQTYYSCIPQGCPAGQYFDGVKCLDLPTSSGHDCSAGYIWDDSQSACFKETCIYKFEGDSIISKDPSVSYTVINKNGNYCYPYGISEYTATMKHGDCLEYKYIKMVLTSKTPGCNYYTSKYCCNER